MTLGRHSRLAAAFLLGGAAAALTIVACGDGITYVAPLADDAGPLDGGAGDAPEALAKRGHDRLSQTGLYADIAKKTIAADVLAFEPSYVLWSDGATKTRWVRLPPGTSIDTTDPDHWVLPVGTQLFKEFVRDGKRVETRLIERVSATGRDEQDYFFGAFLWRDDESDADFIPLGAQNVRGTAHDVPSASTCWSCHVGEPGHALGFSAFQLSHDGKGLLDLATLRATGRVPAELVDRPLQGDATAQAAVGWLHANCGHCHNSNGVAWPDTNMVLRFDYGEGAIETSKLVTTTVNMPTRTYQQDGISMRIESGDPDASAIAHRMSIRGASGAMPPIATELVDEAGIAKVRAWIASMLARDAGAP